MQVLRNVNKYSEWIPYTESSKIVQEVGDSLKCYLFTDAPWPVSDRDGYYLYVYDYVKNSLRGQVFVNAIPEYGAEKDGVIRIRKSEGTWDLKQIEEELVKVIYEVHADPGGNIPNWLASASVTTIPYKTLKSLRERVSRLFANSQ